MSRRTFLASPALLLLATILPGCRTAELPHGGGGALAITHVDVIPMATPGVLRDQAVLVRGDRIAAVGPAAETEIPRGATTLDGRGLFLIPGLADMHEHLPRGGRPSEYSLEDYIERGRIPARSYRKSVIRTTSWLAVP